VCALALRAAGLSLTFVCLSVCQFTTAKMEIDTKLAHNPIVQDTKNGKLRDYHGYGSAPSRTHALQRCERRVVPGASRPPPRPR